MNILIPVSIGELIDKITILQIKKEHITDESKLLHVEQELTLLEQVWKELEYKSEDIDRERKLLRQTNQQLWDIEEGLRYKERLQQFDNEFVDYARREYAANDLRAQVKKRINLLLDSALVEEKSYT